MVPIAAVVTETAAFLFVDQAKLSDEVLEHLSAAHVTVAAYDEVCLHVYTYLHA